MLEYIRAVHDVRPRWCVWENVPGVLSQSGGDAFDTLQRELDECGYSVAWRVIDAQFAGVAQRRRRVFLVGNTRAGAAAAVLFEREGLRWDSPSSRDKRASLAGDAGGGITAFQFGVSSERSLEIGDTAPTIKTDKPPAVCMLNSQENGAIDTELCGTLTASTYLAPTMTVGNSRGALIASDGVIVRRLTPMECERLQGFPDGWTDIYRESRESGTPDAPRYKALGNSMAVPVMRWIGQRIKQVEEVM